MKKTFFERLLASYDSARELVQRPGNNPRWRHPRGVRFFDDLHSLSEAVFQGDVELGDQVAGQGWLSPYVPWYLPGSYAPYRLDTKHVQYGDRWAFQMVPSPAFLPAAQVPFERDGLVLNFLYPRETLGFRLEIPSVQHTAQSQASSGDNGWLINLDTGHCSVDPGRWSHRMGDTQLLEHLERSDERIPLLDARGLRRSVQVPLECQPIPIFTAPRYLSLSHQEVRFTARLLTLDEEALSKLAQLGEPVVEQLFSLFYQPQKMPPFCLWVDEAKADGNIIQQEADPFRSQQRIVPFRVEFFLENLTRDAMVSCDEVEFVDWFVPAAKSLTFDYGSQKFADRWAGKLQGFDGPLHLFKSGPLEISISPQGVFSAHTIINADEKGRWQMSLFQEALSQVQREMITAYKKRHGDQLVTRVTHLTDYRYQPSFGSVLEGRKAKQQLRESGQMQKMIQQFHEFQDSQKSTRMNTIKVLFISASPFGSTPLALGEEIRLIKQKIRAAEHRDCVEIIPVDAARPDDIIQAMSEHRAHVLHFSSHGNRAEELILCDVRGGRKPVSKDALVALFETMGSDVQLVVFNACFSQAQAEAVIEHVPCAIGMSKSVGDEAAIIFAASVYRAIAFGKSVDQAFKEGNLALKLEGIKEDKTPQLLTKTGVDASQVILVNSAKGASKGVLDPR